MINLKQYPKDDNKIIWLIRMYLGTLIVRLSTKSITLSGNEYNAESLYYNSISDISKNFDPFSISIGSYAGLSFAINKYPVIDGLTGLINDYFYPQTEIPLLNQIVDFGICWEGETDESNVDWLFRTRVLNYNIEKEKLNINCIEYHEFENQYIPNRQIIHNQTGTLNPQTGTRDAKLKDQVIPIVYGDFTANASDYVNNDRKLRIAPAVLIESSTLEYICDNHVMAKETGGAEAIGSVFYYDAGLDGYFQLFSYDLTSSPANRQVIVNTNARSGIKLKTGEFPSVYGTGYLIPTIKSASDDLNKESEYYKVYNLDETDYVISEYNKYFKIKFPGTLIQELGTVWHSCILHFDILDNVTDGISIGIGLQEDSAVGDTFYYVNPAGYGLGDRSINVNITDAVLGYGSLTSQDITSRALTLRVRTEGAVANISGAYIVLSTFVANAYAKISPDEVTKRRAQRARQDQGNRGQRSFAPISAIQPPNLQSSAGMTSKGRGYIEELHNDYTDLGAPDQPIIERMNELIYDLFCTEIYAEDNLIAGANTLDGRNTIVTVPGLQTNIADYYKDAYFVNLTTNEIYKILGSDTDRGLNLGELVDDIEGDFCKIIAIQAQSKIDLDSLVSMYSDLRQQKVSIAFNEKTLVTDLLAKLMYESRYLMLKSFDKYKFISLELGDIVHTFQFTLRDSGYRIQQAEIANLDSIYTSFKINNYYDFLSGEYKNQFTVNQDSYSTDQIVSTVGDTLSTLIKDTKQKLNIGISEFEYNFDLGVPDTSNSQNCFTGFVQSIVNWHSNLLIKIELVTDVKNHIHLEIGDKVAVYLDTLIPSDKVMGSKFIITGKTITANPRNPNIRFSLIEVPNFADSLDWGLITESEIPVETEDSENIIVDKN